MSDWIDISFSLFPEMVVWPGDEKVSIRKTAQIGQDGSDANVTAISMSAHTGTHIDAPLHFIENGGDITSLPLSALTGIVKVIEIKNRQEINIDELRQHSITKDDKIIFKTVNTETNWINEPFKANYVYLNPEAARYLVSVGVTTIGIDYLSIGGMETGIEVHKILLGADIVIIEGLNMAAIDPGSYEMFALPLKLTGADGAPARVIVRRVAND